MADKAEPVPVIGSKPCEGSGRLRCHSVHQQREQRVPSQASREESHSCAGCGMRAKSSTLVKRISLYKALLEVLRIRMWGYKEAVEAFI